MRHYLRSNSTLGSRKYSSGAIVERTLSLPATGGYAGKVDKHCAWLMDFTNRLGPQVIYNELVPAPFLVWWYEAAGTGVNENIKYGLCGWWFWLTNRNLYNTLINSLPCPQIWRLFGGRREKGDGAEETIWR